MSVSCKHLRILVVRTDTLKRELAVCEDCDKAVPNWKRRPHLSGRYAYRYKYVPEGDFVKLQGTTTDRERTA